MRHEYGKVGSWRRAIRPVLAACALIGFGFFAWAVFVGVVLPARESARLSDCNRHLAIIRFALESYHERYGCFPPAYIADADGKPMHSWRVLLLEFLDEGALYNRYDFNEPWDGPHNRQLAGELSFIGERKIYSCPGDPANINGTETNYVVIRGKGTLFEDGRSARHEDVTDDQTRTIMVAEAVDTAPISIED